MTSANDYPRNISESIKYRARILKDAENDPILQMQIKEMCRRNILYWINLFCWTKDPRRKPDCMPFVCYDAYQDDYILGIEKAIDDQYDELTEKSRDMGVSWMILYVFTHKWLFEKGSDFRVGSRKEEYVDELNNIDTLLEKVRFNLKRQPEWMLPKGFNIDRNAGFMRIFNPENENAIVGESANPHFGSGGRRKAMLLDEFAKWEVKVAEGAWTSTADATNCRLCVSTPVGSGNKFGQLATGTKEKIKKVTLHWTLHPAKAKGAYYIEADGSIVMLETCKDAFKAWKDGLEPRSPWYDAEAERRAETDLAQEVDIDYLRSGHPFFNLRMLIKQKVWELFKRKRPSDRIPYGYYINAKLVDMDNKIEVREVEDGWLRIFELPVEGEQYVISADTSEGLAKGDESFIVVREKVTRNVIACANGLFKTDDLALKLVKVATFYNKGEVAPENNNHGYAVCEDLKEMDCKLYWTTRLDANDKPKDVKAGFSTTAQSRPAMLDQLEEEIRKESVELRDEVLINQCKTFVKNPKTGKPEADGEYLDDGVITCAIGGAVIKEKPYKAKVKKSEKRRSEVVDRKRKRNAGLKF